MSILLQTIFLNLISDSKKDKNFFDNLQIFWFENFKKS